MKKIIIIFIFALCLLSAMEIICFAKEPYNHGKFWNSWSDNTRTIYISGFKDGFIELNGQFYYDLLLEETGVFDKYLKDLEVVKNEEKNIKEMNDFISLDNEVIINIMTDLYKDPANTYIYFSDMFFIANRKLKGMSIESALEKSREKAFRIMEIENILKNK